VQFTHIEAVSEATPRSASENRIGDLEAEVAGLRERVQTLEQKLEEFRRQFE
jgi:uncharacterized protein YceH (UPF0502 family)